MEIVTNNVPRFTIDAFELTPAERADFDYHDWPAIDDGRDSATFFRYRGTLYDLGEFLSSGAPAGWDGIACDTFFSATLVRLPADDYYGETVVVGRCYS